MSKVKRICVILGIVVLWLTSLHADTWYTKASMPTGRYGLAIGVAGGKIYAIGGGYYGNNYNYLSINEMYDPATNTWTTKASMPTARDGLAIGVVNGEIYAIGGYNGNYLSTNEMYDPDVSCMLISPNGGEMWTGNSTYQITWSTGGSGFTGYNLLLSLDGGTTYSDTIASNISSSDTSYSWTVPNSINSGACKIKVEVLGSGKNVLAYDESDSTFSISPLKVEEHPDIPRSFAIKEASNPTSGYAIIQYQLPYKSKVSLKIYNAAGRLVKDLVEEEKEAGYYTIKWDARGIKSGIYLIQFRAGNYKITRKIVIKK